MARKRREGGGQKSFRAGARTRGRWEQFDWLGEAGGRRLDRLALGAWGLEFGEPLDVSSESRESQVVCLDDVQGAGYTKAVWWDAGLRAEHIHFIPSGAAMAGRKLRSTGLALAMAAAVLLGAAAGGDAEWFNATQALEDVGTLAQTPHSLNDARSIGVRDFLRRTVAAIAASAQGGAQFDDPVASGAAAAFAYKGAAVYWEDSSLVVRVNGTGGGREALLVQAHYDAVPLSHGAYDDGVGVAVCLAVLRMLAQRPARHAVVVNIDWGEESGLFGAAVFARFHAWGDDVRAYINLE
ncbi:hypothetical protein IW150_005159, partial [Coemansia sp. RSA 2607]